METNAPAPHRLTLFCTRHPRTVVFLVLLVTLVLGYFAKGIERDHSFKNMLPADEPIITYYQEFRKHFNIKSKIAIGLRFEDGLFTPEALAEVDRISRWLEGRDFVEDVQSLTTVENITGRGDEIVAAPLMETPPRTAEESAQARAAAFRNAMISRVLVSPDEKSTIIVAQPAFLPHETVKCSDAYREIREMLAREPGPAWTCLAGFPMVTGLTDQFMDRDNRVMLPLILVMVVILLYVSFRSLRGVWIPLAVVLAATLWTFGAMHLLGVKINIISTSIPVVLVAMGIADGIHVINEYYYQLRRGLSNLEAVHLTMKELNAPVVMTSLTTAAGFLALCTSEIVPIREYGAAVAFGILAAMVFSLTFIPASLVLLGRPRKILAAHVAEGGVLNRASERIGGFSLRHAGWVIAVFVVLLVAASAVSSQLRVRNNPVHYFRASSEIRVSDDFLNREFPGTGEIHIQVNGSEDGAMKDPELLARIRSLQDRAEAIDEVGNTRSLVDFLARMNRVLHGEDPAFDRVPGLEESDDPEAGRNLVAQYLLLYEMAGGEELWKMVDDAYRRANIEVNVRSNSSEVYQRVVDRLRAAGEETVGDRAEVAMTGSGVINLKVVRYLVLGQIYSLALSFVVVFLILLFLFRSPVQALIGVIPLLITVALNFAIMVLTGIPLNMGTALIASVCIGIGVDYSIHFINRYGIERQRCPDLASTVQVTMHTSGRAILLNAISVGGGFAVLMFSSFLPIVYLGFLMPLIMAGNAFAALLVIPAFLNVKEGRAESAAGR